VRSLAAILAALEAGRPFDPAEARGAALVLQTLLIADQRAFHGLAHTAVPGVPPSVAAATQDAHAQFEARWAIAVGVTPRTFFTPDLDDVRPVTFQGGPLDGQVLHLPVGLQAWDHRALTSTGPAAAYAADPTAPDTFRLLGDPTQTRTCTFRSGPLDGQTAPVDDRVAHLVAEGPTGPVAYHRDAPDSTTFRYVTPTPPSPPPSADPADVVPYTVDPGSPPATPTDPEAPQPS
jgi:hypothetical protein